MTVSHSPSACCPSQHSARSESSFRRRASASTKEMAKGLMSTQVSSRTMGASSKSTSAMPQPMSQSVPPGVIYLRSMAASFLL